MQNYALQTVKFQKKVYELFALHINAYEMQKTGQFIDFTSKVQYKLRIKMSKSKTFSLTGFSDESSYNFYKQNLVKLGYEYIQNFSQSTNILIVDATWTQKFKTAQLMKNAIPCVTKKWVQDSNKMQCLQPLNQYLISEKQLFLGTTVAICGFTAQKTQKIEKIIKDRKGSTITKYKAIDIILKFDQIPQVPNLILASEDQIQRAQHAKLPKKDENVLPLVRLQWLQDSVNKKRCKHPNDYAVNSITTKQIHQNYGILRTKLTSFLENDIMDKSGDFLQNTMIYIDKQYNMDLIKVLRNLISVRGGYWADNFSSIVTHVLVTDIDETKHNLYKKYGSRIHILRPEWLGDSIMFYNRLPEEDYKMRSYTINDQIIKNIQHEERLRNNQNSQTFNNLPGILDRRNINNSNILPLQFRTLNKKNSQPRSDVFKNRDFYMVPELLDDPYYVQLRKTIHNAGGNIYDRINIKMSVYLPLKDSPDNKLIGQKLFLAKYKFTMVSPRWINQCIKKNCFIQPKLSVYLHFRAYDFNLPLPDFHRFIFEIVGCESVSRLRLRQIITVLGSTKTNPNKAQITHILCGPDASNLQSKMKIAKIYNENRNVQLISSDWVKACLNEKRTIKPCNYAIKILQPQVPRSPQRKGQENQQNSSGNKTVETDNMASIKLTP